MGAKGLIPITFWATEQFGRGVRISIFHVVLSHHSNYAFLSLRAGGHAHAWQISLAPSWSVCALWQGPEHRILYSANAVPGTTDNELRD